MIARNRHLADIAQGLRQFPVVALLGPRQVGKTTLARQVATRWDGHAHLFDWEDPDDQARLSDPSFVLRGLTGLVVLDEMQLRPDLFPLLRVLADRPGTPARFLILGSAAPELLRNTSESLAGRVLFHELDGLALEELPPEQWEMRWLRGGFPRALLAEDLEQSRAWRASLIRTYLERDLPQLGIKLPSLTLRRFWTMLGHYHGQTWNGSELGRALGVSDKTVSRYLDILEGTFMTWRLRPWHTNQGKREVKAPKVYLADTGLLHSLLGIGDEQNLLAHPKCGASWEGFVLHEILRQTHTGRDEAFFWALHSGAELDLLTVRHGRRLGFEVKLTRSPHVTPSMRSAQETLGLDHLFVVCHGNGPPWPLAPGITALPLYALGELASLY
ncbi:ATP-binding protein [Candidatus Symbiobacter mobilis]|uniref:ATPase-like protein n=1 Tax=Candidatus Symbiobacter mobilis CR TaxID=946483 RepID=U5NBR9_9BURK|nr:ATP-binding protein [Candidatus Symbiobacter mobilis]AGX87629.1 ATPase-like protein [Candidatus Symbiobacter mobilis CR]